MNRFLHTTHRNVAWLKSAFDQDQLEVAPPFQRNPVWTDRQKAYLIDSILSGYPIPELYMQEVVDDSGNQQFIVVDGQQRIRACLEFIEGKYALMEEDSPKWADITFEDLSPEEKKRIFEYNFVVRQLPEMAEEELRAIFQRLNRNVVSLNRQELRHAVYWGPFIKTMEDIADYEFWSGARIFTANDIRRMLDVEFVSELTIGMLHGLQNKKLTLDKWYEVYEWEFESESSVRNTFRDVLGEISQVLPDISKTRWRKKSDFYTLFLVFANHVDSLPLASEKRYDASRILVEFGRNVSELLKDMAAVERFSEEVVEYSESVQRAATDYANRKNRGDALEKVLAPNLVTEVNRDGG